MLNLSIKFKGISVLRPRSIRWDTCPSSVEDVPPKDLKIRIFMLCFWKVFCKGSGFETCRMPISAVWCQHASHRGDCWRLLGHKCYSRLCELNTVGFSGSWIPKRNLCNFIYKSLKQVHENWIELSLFESVPHLFLVNKPRWFLAVHMAQLNQVLFYWPPSFAVVAPLVQVAWAWVATICGTNVSLLLPAGPVSDFEQSPIKIFEKRFHEKKYHKRTMQNVPRFWKNISILWRILMPGAGCGCCSLCCSAAKKLLPGGWSRFAKLVSPSVVSSSCSLKRVFLYPSHITWFSVFQ